MIVKELMVRAARAAVWSRPRLYRPVAVLRGRPMPDAAACDVWLGGFPRSANTYTAKVMRHCLDGRRIVSHLHIPPQILLMVEAGVPGLLLLRKPGAAAKSWSLFDGTSLACSLDYYTDFHRSLLGVRDRLFVVPFEAATRDPLGVVREFCARHALACTLSEIAPERVFEEIDDEWPDAGEGREMQVPRPSHERDCLKPDLRHRLEASPALQRRLRTAAGLYDRFVERIPAALRVP